MTYQIIIRKIEDTKSRHDPRVEATILSIINEFFKSNLDVLLYLCDTSDGREKYRDRLFFSCFDKYREKNNFTICKANTVIEGEGLFLCIIIDNRNPNLDKIVTDFQEKADLLTQEKP